MAAELGARPGDRLDLAPVDGGFLLSAVGLDLDQEYLAMLNAFAEVREQYDDTLRRLADS